MSRLIDADVLIERLEVYPVYNGMADMDDIMNFVCEMPTIGGWISVKDKLPNDYKPVYVWLGRGSVLRGGIPFVGRYEPFREGVWQIWGLDGDKSEIVKVTHWMPIEPPEEES